MSDIIDEIKTHRLSTVIEKFVRLQNEGTGRKKCCCPFHHEKTPSFHLDDRNGLYHCFGCGAGGDVFTFIQDYKHCDFAQAIDYLCEILNIDKSKYIVTSEEAIRKANETKTFHQVMDVVAGYYQECLKEDNEAYEYVKTQREMDAITLKEFQLGVADDNCEKLIGYCRIRDIDENMLENCGIIKTGHHVDGEAYKRLFFYNRIIIPIHNSQGNIVAFGGRIYKTNDDNNAKYLNSSDSDFFKKGQVLFNLHRAKNFVGKNNDGDDTPFLIVEGYMDVITLWQHGFKTAIAPLGTSITEKHLRIIFNYCHNPIFVFDSDNAGKKATIRACDMICSMLKTGITPKICTLCGAKDVDEFLKKYTRNDLEQQLSNAMELYEFILEEKKHKFDLTNPNSVAQLQKEIFQLVNSIPDDILRENYSIFFRNELRTIMNTQMSIITRKSFSSSKRIYSKYVKFDNHTNKNMPSCYNKSLDYTEKRILAVLIQLSALQDDSEIQENIVPRFLQKNQDLLINMQEKNDEQKNIFCDHYLNDIPAVERSNINMMRNVLNNLLIQWELTHLEGSNLPMEVKNEERKKILAKKKKILHQLDD